MTRRATARLTRRLARWLLVLAGLAARPVVAVPPISQLPDTAGCVTETGTGGACVVGVALDLSSRVAVSPDGKNVYVAAQLADAVAAFERDVVTGALTQMAGMAACVSETGNGDTCRDGAGLDGAHSVAVSPDGRHVYVAAVGSSSIVALSRSADGAVGLSMCISETGSGGDCLDGDALLAAKGLAISPDGRNVYVAAQSSDAVALFDRDAIGVLAQKGGFDGCISDSGAPPCGEGGNLLGAIAVAVSPDGRNVYVAAIDSDSILTFDRDFDTGELTQKPGMAGCVSDTGTGGECVDGEALDGATAVVVTADGRHVYVASQLADAVAVFDRDSATGGLTQKLGTAGCVSEDGTGGACADGLVLGEPLSVAVSPDGKSLYVASSVSNAVAAFDRDLATGALTQKAGVAACVSANGSGGACVVGAALVSARGLAVSGDGRHVYAAGGVSDGVAAFSRDPRAYDIDGNGESDPLTDGLLLLRYLFDFSGGTLIANAVDLTNCTRCTAPTIEAYIEALLGP